jgi:prephenate dehydratase
MIKNKLKAVAIQGIQGSYHHQVALDHFGADFEILPCDSFQKVVDAVCNDRVEFGIMAIENSIAGSILPNYALIDENPLAIVGEYYLKIKHYVIGIKGQKMKNITEVRSHPIALLQCKETFKKYPNIKIVEDKDTASVAKEIAKQNLVNVAAIASETAAKLYGLDLLMEDVQTIKDNQTRFFILSKKQNETAGESSKASIKFELEDALGSLATVLNILTNCNLNLTKIQSMPVIETPFQYAFFIDVVFENEKYFHKAEKVIKIMTKNYKRFGIYQKFQIK